MVRYRGLYLAHFPPAVAHVVVVFQRSWFLPRGVARPHHHVVESHELMLKISETGFFGCDFAHSPRYVPGTDEAKAMCDAYRVVLPSFPHPLSSIWETFRPMKGVPLGTRGKGYAASVSDSSFPTENNCCHRRNGAFVWAGCIRG